MLMDFEHQLDIVKISHSALKELGLERSINDVAGLLERPKERSWGDWALPCFTLAKELKKSPAEISKTLADTLVHKVESEDWLAEVSAAGPYINFKLSRNEQAQKLLPKILDGTYLERLLHKDEKVMVEYSQPNTHKAFHVGHTRNASLGDSLVRILEWQGYDVVAANYLGDVGAHIAKCLWYYKNHFKGEVPETHRGEFLGNLYSKATELLDFTLLTKAPHPGVVSAKILEVNPHPSNKKWFVTKLSSEKEEFQTVTVLADVKAGDIVAFVKPEIRFNGRFVADAEKGGVKSRGMIPSEKELGISSNNERAYSFPVDTPLGEEVAELLKIPDAVPADQSVISVMEERLNGVSKVLKALEEGEPEITKLWRETRQWCLDEFAEIYKWLDCRFDHDFSESDVGGEGKQIVKEYYKKGVLVESEGAIGADLSAYKLPFNILIKSDGSGLYSTKDIALAKQKFEKFGIDRSLYLVDVSQSLHFQQLFKTLELMGFKQAPKCKHIPYGMVMLPEGKMSSRKGNIILFTELQERLVNKITSEYLESYRGDWSDAEISDAARAISVATIRYGMLNQENAKNITFDLDEWTSRSGNTGPYLMYAYARIKSILRELGEEDFQKADWNLLQHETEHELIRWLVEYHDVVKRSADKLESQQLCIYLYELARAFSRMYSECSVLKAESDELRMARAALAKSVSLVLQHGLGLLGITVIERM